MSDFRYLSMDNQPIPGMYGAVFLWSHCIKWNATFYLRIIENFKHKFTFMSLFNCFDAFGIVSFVLLICHIFMS